MRSTAEKMQFATVEHMRTAFNTGGLVGATVSASGKRFHIIADTKGGGRLCLVRHLDTQPRQFADINTAVRLLAEIGFREVSLNLAAWEPGQKDLKGV